MIFDDRIPDKLFGACIGVVMPLEIRDLACAIAAEAEAEVVDVTKWPASSSSLFFVWDGRGEHAVAE